MTESTLPAKIVVDADHKASQWGFILSFSFTNPEHIDRLSTLPEKDVLYATFTICDDNTGNRHIRGFFKTKRHVHVSALKKLIGPAIFDVVGNVPDVLMETNETIVLRIWRCKHNTV